MKKTLVAGHQSSDLPFAFLGGDHAMEQGIIRGVKSTGGPSYIISYHDAMNVYFKSAPAMARTVADFKQSYNIKKKSENDAHYELTGVSFNDSDVVYNVLSHSVLQQNQGLLNLHEIGEKAEDEFIEKHILGTESVSSLATMKKLKLYMFKGSLKSVKIKVGKKFIVVKKERGIMTRFMIASKTRPGIDLESLVAKHDFLVV